jgi:hypothetical protein
MDAARVRLSPDLSDAQGLRLMAALSFVQDVIAVYPHDDQGPCLLAVFARRRDQERVPATLAALGCFADVLAVEAVELPVGHQMAAFQADHTLRHQLVQQLQAVLAATTPGSDEIMGAITFYRVRELVLDQLRRAQG